ncbi:hypothetical protein LTS18_001089, partial [Coniosporium uncinatum]
MDLQQQDNTSHDPSLPPPILRPIYRPSTLRPIPAHRIPTAPLPQSSVLPSIETPEQADVGREIIKAEDSSRLQEELPSVQYSAGREGTQTAVPDDDSLDLVQSDANGAAQGSNATGPSADDQQARRESENPTYSANTTRQRDSSKPAEKKKLERAKKKEFSQEDDELLLALKEDRGMMWDRIGVFFPERRIGQLQYRYYAKLRPSESLSIRTEKPTAPLLAYGPLEDRTSSMVPDTNQTEDGNRQNSQEATSEERPERDGPDGLFVNDASEEPGAS